MNFAKADRRRLLSVGGLAAGVIGLASAARARPPQPSQPGRGWRAASEASDGWLDNPGTRHRVVFDTTTFQAAAKGVRFASNFYAANQSGYGLKPEELAVLLILRAEATPLGFASRVWQEHGEQFAKLMDLPPDAAKNATKGNPLLSAAGPNEASLAGLQHNGARFAVCGMATHGIASLLAKSAGTDAAAVEADLKANMIPGALIVPAGIVAVNRAQEHGYALSYVS